ncbi:MAG: M14 family zinc carboxypeptidase [Aristaeellaceae bacterium]
MKVIALFVLAAMLIASTGLAEAVDLAAIDWNARYTYAELEDQLQAIAETYPDVTELYPIGTTYQERTLWCMELTNPAIDKADKTGIAVVANIHGGERESASSAMYFAWWLATESATEQVQQILDNYVVYIVPVINPDGYEQSFVYNTRQNMRPRDLNGDGTAFSDPYTDIDGDGYIATLYRGTADVQPEVSRTTPSFGMESPDWDGNGILGDDPRNSGIDMNRTFDYQWNRYDVDSVETGVIGANAWKSAGSGPATEPEVKAIQNFLLNNDIDAMATLHTGIQCVLYPWCYRAYDPEVDSDDIPFMKETAAEMAAAFQETTGRGFYSMSSYEDYPTSAELIDYAYGRLNIHAYTIEVYSGGKSEDGSIEACKWENTLPEAKWVFYSQDELAEMGLDPAAITDSQGNGLAEGEGLWFYTSSTAQMVDKAPEDQATMVQGCRDALLVMINSEPYGDGYTKPAYLNW